MNKILPEWSFLTVAIDLDFGGSMELCNANLWSPLLFDLYEIGSSYILWEDVCALENFIDFCFGGKALGGGDGGTLTGRLDDVLA